MRLHGLTVTAFGPFAGTEHVDFDELNEAGLFLLTGPTGAGKSSLLDAVCFALYGTVPGARGVKTLRSQHAAADARPEVELDFSVQGRRFVVRRTPEWARPKRRGTGVLTEKASAAITETTGGTDHFLSGRAAEVGLLVGGLMGMSAGQFVQVALLPQGEFQTFLRASSQDRHDVLEQLFRTDRFSRIEDWVGDHSRRLKDLADTGRSTVQRVLDTVADRAGLGSPPEPLGGDEPATAAAEGAVRAWATGVLADAATEAGSAREQHARSRRALRVARDRYDRELSRSERRSAREAALRALDVLEESGQAAAQVREALAAHERATRCRPVLELHARALETRHQAAACRDRAVLAVTMAPTPSVACGPGVLPADLTDARLTSAVDGLRARVARLEALVPREQAAVAARRRRDLDATRLERAEQDLRDAADRAQRIPEEIEACTAMLSAAAIRAARLEALTPALDAARARHDAAAELVGVRHRLADLDEARRDARDRMQDAREALQILVARRLAGMAAELAGGLVDGTACQVCGSIEHPRPATPEVDAVTHVDHERAERLLTLAAAGLEAAEQAVRDVQRRHDALAVAGAGLCPDQAAEQVTGLETELADATAARREQAALTTELRALREEQETLSRRQAAAAAEVARLGESVTADDRVVATVADEITAALGGDTGTSSVADAAVALAARCDLLVEARRAVAGLDAAEAALAELSRQALVAATEHGFTELADVEGAVLSADTRERLDRELRERADAEAVARAVLHGADPGDRGEAADDGAHVDLTALALAVAEAESAAADAARVLALHEDRLTSLTRLLDRLTTALDAWAPVRDEALRADAVSRLIRGMGHDNQLQMRLSAYVLATRLDQVVAAANERLGHMRDQRYLLQRTGRAERRSAQAGLGLEVVDQWTGDVRAPSTLSGGETFVVSLSLALGLADVVTHESGGTEVETLFVDEGFGTLDADTLDDVMDRLDGLRAGGRTVGVVSHVTELRGRIPTQVQVEKGRTGSTVTVRTLVG
jgi:exonuclease SbcC